MKEGKNSDGDWVRADGPVKGEYWITWTRGDKIYYVVKVPKEYLDELQPTYGEWQTVIPSAFTAPYELDLDPTDNHVKRWRYVYPPKQEPKP